MKMVSFRNISVVLLLLPPVPVETRAHSTSENLQRRALTVTARVDTRVELLSIIARLAGYEEYSSNFFKSYVDDVNRHFEKYKQHPAVLFAKKIRASSEVGFDAVMSMAVHLHPPPALTPRVRFTDQLPDRRWGKESALEFGQLLQQFYKDADCERFFTSHTELYRTAEQRFQQLLNSVDFAWYQRFYGELPRGTFHLIIGLLNGGGNFGPKVVHPDGREDLYAIIGTWQIDGGGLPLYDTTILPTIIHEYNHSFINHLVYAREKQFRPAGEKVFQPVAAQMKRLAYGNWQTVILESIVRAAVIRYMLEHDTQPQKAYREVAAERNSGFIWMDELFTLLGAYENNRNAYPTFRSFIPMIEGYYRDLAKRIEYKAGIFDELRPRVLSMGPFMNGAQDVDPALARLTFTFDRPLDPQAGHSISAPRGQEHNPVGKTILFNEAGSAITVEVKLQPDKEYEFVLTGRAFSTKDGYPLSPYGVKFKTRKL